MHMLSRCASAGMLLMLTACTSGADPDPVAAPTTPLSQAGTQRPSQGPSLALTNLSLTCEGRNERHARGTVRGNVIGLTSTAPHEVNVVQGADSTLGRAALPPVDAAGAASFDVKVEKVFAEQPVRVVLRQSGVRSLSVLVEVMPDAATCSKR